MLLPTGFPCSIAPNETIVNARFESQLGTGQDFQPVGVSFGLCFGLEGGIIMELDLQWNGDIEAIDINLGAIPRCQHEVLTVLHSCSLLSMHCPQQC